jgi:hypothetical protein
LTPAIRSGLSRLEKHPRVSLPASPSALAAHQTELQADTKGNDRIEICRKEKRGIEGEKESGNRRKENERNGKKVK